MKEKIDSLKEKYDFKIESDISIPDKKETVKSSNENEKQTIIGLNTEKDIKLEDLEFIKLKKKDQTKFTMEDLINELF